MIHWNLSKIQDERPCGKPNRTKAHRDLYVIVENCKRHIRLVRITAEINVSESREILHYSKSRKTHIQMVEFCIPQLSFGKYCNLSNTTNHSV